MMSFLVSVCIAASALILYHTGESIQWDAAWSVGGVSAPMHVAALSLGVVTYVRITRGTWIGVNDVYGMALMCVVGTTLAILCVSSITVGLYPAAAAVGAVLCVATYASYVIVPRGIRLAKHTFGGSTRGQPNSIQDAG